MELFKFYSNKVLIVVVIFYHMPIPQPVIPIRDRTGNVIGINDPNRGQTRLPTESERIAYRQPVNQPSISHGGGGGGHVNNNNLHQPSPTIIEKPKPLDTTSKLIANENSLYIVEGGKVIYDARQWVGKPTYVEFIRNQNAYKNYLAQKQYGYDLASTQQSTIRPELSINPQLKQNVPSASNDFGQSMPRFTTSRWEAFKQTAYNVVHPSTWRESREEKLARVKSITDTNGPKIERETIWGRIVEPFKDTGRLVRDEPSGIFKKGTINPNESPVFTKGEIVAQQKVGINLDISKKTTPIVNEWKNDLQTKHDEIQAKVDSGKITIDEATKELNDYSNSIKDNYNKRIEAATEKEYNRLSKASNRYGNLGESRDYLTAKDLPKTAETGLLIGAAAISGGQGLITAELLGTGIYKQEQIQQKEKEGYKVSLFERADPILRVGLSAVGGKGALTNVERGIIQEQFSQLWNAPIRFRQVNYVNEDESLVKFVAQQKYGGMIRNIEGYGQVVKQGEDEFIMPIGEMASTTTGRTWNILNAQKGTNLWQFDYSVIGAKGTTKTLTPAVIKGLNIPYAGTEESLNEFSIGISKNVLEPKLSATALYGLNAKGNLLFSTSAKLGGEPLTSLGVSVSKKVNPDMFGNERFFSTGLNLQKDRLPIRQSGVTTIIKQEPKESNILFKGEGNAKSGKGLFEDIGKQETNNDNLGLLTQNTKQESSFGFETAISQQSKQSEASLFEALGNEQQQSRSLLPKTKQELKTEVRQKPQSLSLLSNALEQKQETAESLIGPIPQQSLLPPVLETRQSNQQVISLLQPESVIPRVEQRQATSLISPKITGDINPPINVPIDVPLFGLPVKGSLETGGGSRVYPQRQSLFGKTKYNASLGAVLTKQKRKKVTSQEAESLSNIKFSGLEDRPLLEISDKPKKSRSRKIK